MPSSKWLIFLPVALFALFAPQPAQASQVGLLVRGYQIDQIPPVKSDIAYPMCGSSVEPFINATWDGQPFEQCGDDLFMLHYTGFIQIPEHETIEFWIASDDGGTIQIGDQIGFGVWQDQGCSATMSGEVNIAAGTQSVDFWMYENGGGTCAMFAWKIDDGQWEIVQPEFFTSEPLVPATTSTLETTTTTFLPTTTAAPQTTTTLPQTTSSTYQTPVVPETTTTTQEVPIPQTTQSVLPIPEPSTSVQTTQPETTTTQPATTTSTMPVLPPVSVSNAPETTTPTVTTPTTLLTPQQPITPAQFAEALTAISQSTPEQITQIVDTILAAELSTEQAEQLVASTEILTAVTPQQAQQLFQQVEETQLSESMAAVIAEALNNPDVPTEVKEAFEDAINIFGNDGFDTYVPVDSVVSVAVRRTIVAGTTILMALPAPAPVRRT